MDRTKSVSEVARLLREMDAVLMSLKVGLCGYAEGMARHQFIQARLRRLDTYHEELQTHIGEGQATEALCERYHEIMESDECAETNG